MLQIYIFIYKCLLNIFKMCSKYILYLKYFLYFTVSFPKPQSPLLDIQVIVGSEQILAGLVKKFEEHITEADSTVWNSLQWLTEEL